MAVRGAQENQILPSRLVRAAIRFGAERAYGRGIMMTIRTMPPKIAKIALGAALAVSIAGVAKADETRYHFNLAAGATTAAILVPGAASPTTLTCTASVAADSGVGQATLLRLVPTSFIQWVGFDQASNMGTSAKISQGFSATLGTHIIFCDFGGQVDVQIVNGTSIQVKNSNGNVANLVLHFVY